MALLKRRLINLSFTLLCLVILQASALAAPVSVTANTVNQPPNPSAPPEVTFISAYQTMDHQPVYGLFDMEGKPSVRILWAGTAPEAKLGLTLHGLQYVKSAHTAFTMQIGFETRQGRVLKQNPPIAYLPGVKTLLPPHWFLGLDKTAGYSGTQYITVQVPPGTEVVTLCAIPPKGGSILTANHLLGYVAHIQPR